MVENVIYNVIEDVAGPSGINFKKGQEIQIVRGMVYMGGHPLAPQYQDSVLKWVETNKKSLKQVGLY
jgi:hypothetical protein